MHLYLALLCRRDYFARLNASLSGSFVPQGLLYPGRMHLYLALLRRRDYSARPDASLSGSFVPQGLFRPVRCISIWLFCAAGMISPGWMHLYLALLFRRDYFARPDASHHWKAIAKNISARPFRQIQIFLHRIKEKIFSLLTFLPSFAFILSYSKAVIDMFKGFQISPGLVYYIPLNIIRCQQARRSETHASPATFQAPNRKTPTASVHRLLLPS